MELRKTRTRLLAALGCLALLCGLLLAGATPAAATASSEGFAYAQLTDQLAKDFYNTLASGAPGSATVLTVQTSVVLSGTRQGFDAIPELSNRVSKAHQDAFNAVLIDRPDLFWIAGSQIGWSMSGADLGGGTYRVTYQNYKITPKVGDDYKTGAAALQTQLTAAIAAFPVSGATRYEKVKSIHDKLCQTVYYDLNKPMAHQVTGPLLKGWAVCEGYAKAMKLLCEREGIPCLLVTGWGVTGSGAELHMWNLVQMDDGKWYGLDATWDDQDSRIYYDFFLVGSNTASSAGFGGTTFGYSHQADNDGFVRPAMELNKYDPASVTTTTTTTTTTTLPPTTTTTTTTLPPTTTTTTTTLAPTTTTTTTTLPPTTTTTTTTLPPTTTTTTTTLPPTTTTTTTTLPPTTTTTTTTLPPTTTTTTTTLPPTTTTPTTTTLPPTTTTTTTTTAPQPPAPGLMLGDPNGDGKIDSGDARLILQYEVRTVNLTAAQLVAADVNRDGRVDSSDARKILQYEVKLITQF